MITKHIIHMENGRLASDTPLSIVQQIVADAVTTNNIVIHFHGGLVSEANARSMAQRLTPVYQQAGAYPIFPVWEAGLFETISNNFGKLATEDLFQLVLKRVKNIARRKFSQDDGGRSGGIIPPDIGADEEEFAEPVPDPTLTLLSDTETLALEMELQQDTELLLVAQAVSAGLRKPADIAKDEATRSTEPVVASSDTLMDSDAVERLVDRPDAMSRGLFSTIKIAKAIVVVAGRVIARYVRGREHGFHATGVEEILREFYLANIGGTIWAQMKGDTKDSFGANPAVFGGTALLSELGHKIKSGAVPKVTLIGHSTGAVYIAHLLVAADQLIPAGFTFDIILLAPASTFDLTVSSFIPHRERIGGFRMFTMTDKNEKSDRLVPVLYPHSLLYFVSGVVEPDADTPLIGMQRYYDQSWYKASKFREVEEFRQFIGSFNDGVIWSVSKDNGSGFETEAIKHGDFDNDPKTLESVQHIIKHGF